jgi:hypothetical protein
MAKIRARARAVDMLGRQQIAGIQNALSELFKNAHDAYADSVLVDYFENVGANGEGFIVVRDDGIGMTREDFEEKWLVLGTESKTTNKRAQMYRPPDKPPRPITGEKGIGRLAIALLGRQVLILTRAKRGDGVHDLVVALVHWGLFEVPGLNLEDIEVPVAIFAGGLLPKLEDICALRDQLTSCCKKIVKEHDEVDLQEILGEIEAFRPDPASMNTFFASRDEALLTLEGSNTGTHFLIGPSNPVIKLEIATEIKIDDYSFRKQLLGFSDQTFGDDDSPSVRTSFKRWLPGDLFGQEFLDSSIFFTKDELAKADHRLCGTIDEYGQFRGTLATFDPRLPHPANVSCNSPDCSCNADVRLRSFGEMGDEKETAPTAVASFADSFVGSAICIL